MSTDKEELAKIMIAEMGKTIHEARGEVDYAVGYFTWFAGEAIRVFGQVIPSHIPNKHLWYEYRPVGVCGMITPWNFPLAMVARKIAPAIAAGCSTLVKPSPEAPCTVLALAEILERCGFPPGLLNVLIGEERSIGEKILSSNIVRKISFTGSTAVGQLLFAASAPTLKHTTMELGGLAPLIIFNDAQIDTAVDETIRAKFRNNGQACVGANRIFVQEEIYRTLCRTCSQVKSRRSLF